ncbi:MAG: response regulator [Nitrospirota bacterium]|nr:response regulator [Nitrospirota bacterium]
MKKFTSKSVLIAEDHSAARKILTVLIQKLGVTQVESVANGVEALARIQVQPADLLIVDWNMPEMDGLELLKAIRADKNTEGTKVLMVTADDDRDHVLQAILAGADGYLVKPVTIERLEQKLDDIFREC